MTRPRRLATALSEVDLHPVLGPWYAYAQHVCLRRRCLQRGPHSTPMPSRVPAQGPTHDASVQPLVAHTFVAHP